MGLAERPRGQSAGAARAAAPRDGFRRKFYHLRLLILLAVLLGVACLRARILWEERRPVDWSAPHPVLVCPILAPGADAGPLGASLAASAGALETWAGEQFRLTTGRSGSPLRVTVVTPVAAERLPPPLPPEEAGFIARWRGVRDFLGWYRAFDSRFPPLPEGGSRVYLLLFTGQAESALLGRESVGTRRGRVGVVFAPDLVAAWGNTLALIAHETLHTIGALNHRDPDGYVAWPDGYANPEAMPRFPQRKAEAMALGIPVSQTAELRVDGLDEVVLGPATAREIGWFTPLR